MPDLLDGLRDQRAALRSANDAILTRAATEQRDLTGEELGEHTARAVEVRELDDRIEQVLADQVAELRAAQTRRPGAPNGSRDPVLTREQSVTGCRPAARSTRPPNRFPCSATSVGWRPGHGRGPSTRGR